MVNALDSKASACKKRFHPSTFHLNWLDKIDTIEDFHYFWHKIWLRNCRHCPKNRLKLSKKMSIIISKFLFASDLNFTGRPNLTSLTNWIHARAKCLWKSIKCKYEVWKNNSQKKIWVSTTLKVLFWVCYDFFDLLVIAI